MNRLGTLASLETGTFVSSLGPGRAERPAAEIATYQGCLLKAGGDGASQSPARVGSGLGWRSLPQNTGSSESSLLRYLPFTYW